MVNTRRLRGYITMAGYTGRTLSKELGICETTLSYKLKHDPDKFTQKEIEDMIRILNIPDAMDVFFG